MNTTFHRVVNSKVLGLVLGAASVIGLSQPAGAASDYKVIHEHKIKMGDWQHQGHNPSRVIKFNLPRNFNNNDRVVLQMNINSTNKSQYNAFYLNPRYKFESEVCDSASNDREERSRIDYLPKAEHKEWKVYHKVIDGNYLQTGDNYLLICSRNQHGDGMHDLDKFYVKDIVLHYRERQPRPGF